ncbi:MAG: hypothetical protein U9R74_00980 [Pseudomonadota bacterium]|nr:hypothetical protein [Pseudomonadota bacterium]
MNRFVLLAGAIFHSDFSDRMQMILFMKNLAIAGGFLVPGVNGPGEISLEARTS